MASTSAAARARAPKENFEVGNKVFYETDGVSYPGTVVDVRAETAFNVNFKIIGASTPTYTTGTERTQRGDIKPFVNMNRSELIENSVHKVKLIGFGGPEDQTIQIIKVIPHVESDMSVEYTVRLDNPNSYSGPSLKGPATGYKYVLAHDGELTRMVDEHGNAMTASTAAEAVTSSTSAAASAPAASTEGGRRRRRRRTQRRRTQRRRASKIRHRR